MVPTTYSLAEFSGILNEYVSDKIGALLGPLMINVKVPKAEFVPSLKCN